jgi:hypothetical protein
MDEATELAQLREGLLVLDHKALHQKRRLEPRTVELGNEHADAQIRSCDDFLQLTLPERPQAGVHCVTAFRLRRRIRN